MSKSNGKNKNKNNSNSNSKNFLISKNKTTRFSAAPGASLTRTLYVSLDNADKVIDGVPHSSAFCAKGWEGRRCQRHDFSNSRTPLFSRFRNPWIVARALSSAAHFIVDRTPAKKTGGSYQRFAFVPANKAPPKQSLNGAPSRAD
jgi:hypothetical protein